MKDIQNSFHLNVSEKKHEWKQALRCIRTNEETLQARTSTRIRQEWKSKASVELSFLFIISEELSHHIFSNKNRSSGHKENLNQQEGNRKDGGWNNEASGMGWGGRFSLFQILANKSGFCLYLCNTTTCPECSRDPIIFTMRKKQIGKIWSFNRFPQINFMQSSLVYNTVHILCNVKFFK